MPDLSNGHSVRGRRISTAASPPHWSQVSPKFLASLSDIASAFIDIFNYIRKGTAAGFATSTSTSGHHHHRSLQQTTTSSSSSSSTGSRSASNQPLPEQLLAAFLTAGLQAPELQGALGGLSSMYGDDLDQLVQLVVDVYVAVRDLATKVRGLAVGQLDGLGGCFPRAYRLCPCLPLSQQSRASQPLPNW